MEKLFSFKKLNGEELVLSCYSKDTRNGFYHKCETLDGEMFARVSYLNRTWERFDFESVLYRFFDKYYSGLELEFLNKQLKAIADQKSEECNKWVENMTKMYNALSDNAKNRMAEVLEKNDIDITSQEQVDSILKTTLLFDTMGTF